MTKPIGYKTEAALTAARVAGEITCSIIAQKMDAVDTSSVGIIYRSVLRAVKDGIDEILPDGKKEDRDATR